MPTGHGAAWVGGRGPDRQPWWLLRAGAAGEQPRTYHLWELDVRKAGDESLAEARQLLQQAFIVLLYELVLLLYCLQVALHRCDLKWKRLGTVSGSSGPVSKVSLWRRGTC